jgi:aryl-alcohol dehydrogenase-like predicted oxidoreductase
LASDLPTCRILNGMWQVSGAHGGIDPTAAVEQMLAHYDAGLTTWDLADHYGPAEDFIGTFLSRLAADRGVAALADVQAFTKWVPMPGPMTSSVVEAAIARSLRRMGVEALDLLQFHWWDYDDERYLDALDELQRLQTEGRIRHLALTNFDTAHLETIVNHGIRIVSNQVQYSLIDRRPEVRMADYCRTHEIALLCYGTLCGGLLSERFLGQPEPERPRWMGALLVRSPTIQVLDTASLQKYKQMVDAWGGWSLFQELLAALKHVADKHGVSIANVAVRWILDRPTVAGAIVGVRLGVSDHVAENLRVFDLQLDDEDRERIDAVLARARDLFRVIGDCGDEYRR